MRSEVRNMLRTEMRDQNTDPKTAKGRNLAIPIELTNLLIAVQHRLLILPSQIKYVRP